MTTNTLTPRARRRGRRDDPRDPAPAPAPAVNPDAAEADIDGPAVDSPTVEDAVTTDNPANFAVAASAPADPTVDPPTPEAVNAFAANPFADWSAAAVEPAFVPPAQLLTHPVPPTAPASRSPDDVGRSALSPYAAPPGDPTPAVVIDPSEFAATFGEPIQQTLDLSTWADGLDLSSGIDRLEAEVARAVDAEDGLRAQTRALLFPRLADHGGGVFRVTRAQLEHAQRTVLLTGAVEAADGLCAVHDTLPLTVAQIGVCLAGYGDAGGPGAATWGHRLYRREMRASAGDPIEEALAILERRDLRADAAAQGRRDLLSHLFRRGILAYAERAVLLKRSTKPWRMGRGTPAPHELLTGSGNMELLHASLDVLRGLLLEHKRFLFVPPESGERLLLTIGNALEPRSFAIVESAQRRMEPLVAEGHLVGRHYRAARRFYEDAAPRIVCGVYRTFPDTPPQVFYAHQDHAEEAAVIAMADSLLQPHRTFPALLHLAGTVCQEWFGAEGFNASVQAAYAGRGCPLRYTSERQTKR